MDPRQAVIHLKYDPDGTLPAALEETHPSQGTAMWTSTLVELSDSGPLQIDWMVSICLLTPDLMGQEERAAEAWAQDMTALTDSLASIRGIRAATFIILDS